MPNDATPHSPAQDIRRARIWLTRAVEPGDITLHAALTELGPVETARRLAASATSEPFPGIAAPHRGLDVVAADLATADQLGIRPVTPDEDEWPHQQLQAMRAAADRGVPGSAPPVALWTHGPARLGELVGRAVAVIGTRAASPYGTRVAGDLAYRLAARGWTVISGGGYGIDEAAHRGALVAGGPTIAVLGSGLRRPYPSGNASLFADIRRSGLLISEWPPDCVTARQRILQRTRLIAGLAAAVVIVETLTTSGAIHSGQWATTYGRPLLAIPGPVISTASAGCHLLLQAGKARLVTNTDQILDAVTTS